MYLHVYMYILVQLELKLKAVYPLIQAAVKDNVELQSELVTSLVCYGDYPLATKYCQLYGIPPGDISPALASFMTPINQNGEQGIELEPSCQDGKGGVKKKGRPKKCRNNQPLLNKGEDRNIDGNLLVGAAHSSKQNPMYVQLSKG